MFVTNKLISINKNVNKIINLTETVYKTVKYILKVIGNIVVVNVAAKGTVDFLEAVAYQDGVCAFISVVEVLPIRIAPSKFLCANKSYHFFRL